MSDAAIVVEAPALLPTVTTPLQSAIVLLFTCDTVAGISDQRFTLLITSIRYQS